MARTHTHGEPVGKAVAVFIFLLGIAALGLIFSVAFHMFQSPIPGLVLPTPKGQPPPTPMGILSAFALLLGKLFVLALLVWIASQVASKGLHLYQAAVSAQHPLSPPDAPGTPTATPPASPTSNNIN